MNITDAKALAAHVATPSTSSTPTPHDSLNLRRGIARASTLEAAGTSEAVAPAAMASRQELHRQVQVLAWRAGKVALDWQQRMPEASFKGLTDPVTRGGKETKRFVCGWIHEHYPSHGILGEESGESSGWRGAEARWLIDPIDGTTNYMRGHPFWAVLIAVQQKDASGEFDTVVSAVYAPVERALFSTLRGGGCFLNGQPIAVSNKSTLIRSLLATDYAYEDKHCGATSNDESFVRLRSRCQNVHVTGSSGLNLAYVAAGRYDAFWHRALKPWDVAAGALLVQEAGGTVTNLFADHFSAFEGSILASNGAIHQSSLTEILASIDTVDEVEPSAS